MGRRCARCRVWHHSCTTREDFIKATLQRLAYQTRDVVDTMEKDTGIAIPALRVDGGAAKNDYLMQFQADIIDTPIERAANLETTAMGAAFLAGLAVGFWKNTDELKKIAAVGKRFEPKMADDRVNTCIKAGNKPSKPRWSSNTNLICLFNCHPQPD